MRKTRRHCEGSVRVYLNVPARATCSKSLTTVRQRNLLWECKLETTGFRSCPLPRFGMTGVIYILLGYQCLPCGLPRSSVWTASTLRIQRIIGNWIQHVNRMPRSRLPRVMKHYSPNDRRNHGRHLKRLLDTWDRKGSTNGPIPWQIHDDDDDDDDDDDELTRKSRNTCGKY